MPFQPKETLLFIRLVKWALQALDVYTLPLAPGMAPVPAGVQRPINVPNVRTKEEKEVLEHFAGVVSFIKKNMYIVFVITIMLFLIHSLYLSFPVLNDAFPDISRDFLNYN